jgi:hypothetical protein
MGSCRPLKSVSDCATHRICNLHSHPAVPPVAIAHRDDIQREGRTQDQCEGESCSVLAPAMKARRAETPERSAGGAPSMHCSERTSSA